MFPCSFTEEDLVYVMCLLNIEVIKFLFLIVLLLKKCLKAIHMLSFKVLMLWGLVAGMQKHQQSFSSLERACRCRVSDIILNTCI